MLCTVGSDTLPCYPGLSTHLFILRAHANAGVQPLLVHVVEGDPQVDAILEEGYRRSGTIQQHANCVACVCACKLSSQHVQGLRSGHRHRAAAPPHAHSLCSHCSLLSLECKLGKGKLRACAVGRAILPALA